VSESWRETAADFGLPEEVLLGAVDERLGQMVRAQAIAGAIQGAVPPEELNGLAAWMQQNQAVAEHVGNIGNTDPQGAADFARLAYQDAQRRGRAPQSQPQQQQSQFEGRTAGLLGPQGGPPRPVDVVPQGELAPTWQSGEMSVEEAAAAYQRTGSKKAAEDYARARLRATRQQNGITDSFLLG
jgi:hypothetical protein